MNAGNSVLRELAQFSTMLVSRLWCRLLFLLFFLVHTDNFFTVSIWYSNEWKISISVCISNECRPDKVGGRDVVHGKEREKKCFDDDTEKTCKLCLHLFSLHLMKTIFSFPQWKCLFFNFPCLFRQKLQMFEHKVVEVGILIRETNTNFVWGSFDDSSDSLQSSNFDFLYVKFANFSSDWNLLTSEYCNFSIHSKRGNSIVKNSIQFDTEYWFDDETVSCTETELALS